MSCGILHGTTPSQVEVLNKHHTTKSSHNGVTLNQLYQIVLRMWLNTHFGHFIESNSPEIPDLEQPVHLSSPK